MLLIIWRSSASNVLCVYRVLDTLGTLREHWRSNKEASRVLFQRSKFISLQLYRPPLSLDHFLNKIIGKYKKYMGGINFSSLDIQVFKVMYLFVFRRGHLVCVLLRIMYHGAKILNLKPQLCKHNLSYKQARSMQKIDCRNRVDFCWAYAQAFCWNYPWQAKLVKQVLNQFRLMYFAHNWVEMLTCCEPTFP